MRVGCFRSFKPAIHFGAKLRLPRLHAFVAHCLVFGGVRLDLRAVERDMPELRQPGFFRKLQHLQKQPPQRRQMTLPEVGDRAKIWRVVRHDHHEIDPLSACLRDPSRGIKTRAIGIEQQGPSSCADRIAADQARFCILRRSPSDPSAPAPKRRRTAPDGPPARNRPPPPATVVSDQLSKDENVCSCLNGIRFVPKMPPLLGHAPRS